MDLKVRRKILPSVQALPRSSGSLPDAFPHLLQMCKKELSLAKWEEVSKARSQSSPRAQYWGVCLTDLSLLFLTGWPAWITVLGTWNKDPGWCMFSTTWLFEENKYFSEGLSPQSSAQVRQTALLMLRLCCCWALALLQRTEQRIFSIQFGSRGALSPLPAISVGVKSYVVFIAWGMFFSKNVLSEDQDCSYSWDKYRLKVWEEYAEKIKMLQMRY